MKKKSFLEKLKKGELKGIGTFCALLSGVMGGISPVLQKYGMPGLEFNPIRSGDWAAVLSNVWFLLGSAFGILTVAILIVAFSYGKAAVLFPLSGGTGYLACFLGGYFILGESITWLKVLGIVVLTVGISTLSRIAS